jgi:hypothetical protein
MYLAYFPPPPLNPKRMLRFSLYLLLLHFLALQIARSAEPVMSQPEFSIDVMSVLSKAGCNAGACHGNLNGKGGLKLSLRGQDPVFDYQSLALASRGRRINCGSPERSLLLLKATGQVAHIGGTRFDAASQEYEVLRRWIEAGASQPSAASPTLTQLEVEPLDAIVAAPLAEIQVKVRAHYSDGSSRDVTDRACYELSNLDATVDQAGLVRRSQFTETTLIVRYLQRQVPVRIAFIDERSKFTWENAPSTNFIDQHVFSKLQRLRLNPSPLCDDTVFVRRSYLDAIGRGPTAEEAQDFVYDTAADKRQELIDRLLQRPEFADFWALKWADVLRTEEKVLDAVGVDHFHAWIRESITVGKPIDHFVRELVTGIGSTYENPAANYYRANRDPTTRGETTARLFLGVRMQCAKCHNHPFDHWTQDDYYQWASVFSQIDYELGENKRKDKLDKNEFAGEQKVFVSKQKEVVNPNTGSLASPKFLGGELLSEEQLTNRLEAVAQWLTTKDNALFAKSQANFIWYQLMGTGLVDPIDDFRLTNPPSNAPLLDALASHLIHENFDLRAVVRTIMNSRSYQLSSEHNDTNADDSMSFSHARVRRLPAEVILDLQSDVLAVPAAFGGFERGIRAVQIPGVERVRPRDGAAMAGDRFLKTFGKPERIMACDCERTNETTLKQALSLLGDGLNARLADPENRLAKMAASSMSDSELVDQLYWGTLSRPPAEAEAEAATALLRASNRDRFLALQDIAWALMNAKEFLFRR